MVAADVAMFTAVAAAITSAATVAVSLLAILPILVVVLGVAAVSFAVCCRVVPMLSRRVESLLLLFNSLICVP